jgi:hydrogenase nickel incorporation protein HypB
MWKPRRDGQRIAALNVPVTQILTNGTCHLDAGMVGRGVERMDLTKTDLPFIENVGNLVCPAAYSLGEHLRIIVMSATDGEDETRLTSRLISL